jgi:lipopolysaccharide export system permease protein
MIFHRYLIKHFFKFFCLMLICLIIVFVVMDYVGNMRFWQERPFADVAKYYSYYVPHIVYMMMPVVLLLTTITTIGAMARHLELVSMQSGGQSPWKIFSPFVLILLLLGGGKYLLTEYVIPDANHNRLEMAQIHQKDWARRETQRSHFIYIGAASATYYFRSYRASDKTGIDVTLFLFDKEGKIRERFDARRMTWQEQWILENGRHRIFHLDGTIGVAEFERMEMAGILQEDPEDLINSRFSPDEMNSKQLLERIEILRRTGENTAALETQYHLKLSGVFVSLLVAIMALALAHKKRRGGLTWSFGIGLLATFSYYILIKLGVLMGENGVTEPWIAAWGGNILFSVATLIVLIRSFKL